tara:strand:+ start:355 stop:564 length:210 start_codon:yes stop_codon:yes gene_type:complete
MPIYKVTSDAHGTYGDNISVVVRGIDILDAIDTALTCYSCRGWTRANCGTELLDPEGESKVFVEENVGG